MKIFTPILFVGIALIASGCGPKSDRILKPSESQRVRAAAIITSRVVSSPYYSSERANGVGVWDEQFHALRLGGPLLAAAGKRRDEEAAQKLNTRLKAYDFEELLAERLYERLSLQAPYTVIAREEAQETGMEDVNFKIGREIIRRKKSYIDLATELGADVIIDLRVVEWALIYQPGSNDVKARLRVRVRVIKHPENLTFYNHEIVSTPDLRELDFNIDNYLANYGELLKVQTAEAIDDVITQLLRDLLI